MTNNEAEIKYWNHYIIFSLIMLLLYASLFVSMIVGFDGIQFTVERVKSGLIMLVKIIGVLITGNLILAVCVDIIYSFVKRNHVGMKENIRNNFKSDYFISED